MLTDKPLAIFENAGTVRSMVLMPDGQRLLSAGNDKVRLWKIGESSPLQTLDARYVFSVALFDDGERFLTASDDGKARLWRIGEDKPLAVFDARNDTTAPPPPLAYLSPPSVSLTATAILPDGKQFLTGSLEGNVKLWRIGEERPLAEFDAGGSVYSIVLSADGQSFVITSDAGVSKWRIPEAPLATAVRQVEIACAALKESGVIMFSEEDFQRFPLLDRDAPHPCAKLWGYDPRGMREPETVAH